MHRVTINEIARRAGVSKGAVSYALNGRPGVSEETRHGSSTWPMSSGWAPNRTARMLSGSRTETFGLILARDPRTLGRSRSTWSSSPACRASCPNAAYALLLQLTTSSADELELYPRWWSERRVDAVVIVDIRRRRSPGRLPSASWRSPPCSSAIPSMTGGFTTVWTDDAAAMDGRDRAPGRARSPTVRTGRRACPISATSGCGTTPSIRPCRRYGLCGDDRARRLLRRTPVGRRPATCGRRPIRRRR